MKRIISVILFSIITISTSFAQILSIGTGIAYKESFKEKSIYTKTINGFLTLGAGIYSQPFLKIPLKTGIDFSFGEKTILSYSAPKNQPLGTGSTDINRSIKLIIIEIPFLYRFYQNKIISILMGVKIGLNKATINEHFSGLDFSNTSTVPTLGISSEIEFKLSSLFSLGGFINYRFLKNKIIDFRDYDYSGFWFDMKVLYSL